MVKVVETEADFKEKIATGITLVDFYADWCGPCRMLSPVIEKVAGETPGVKFIKVNVEDLQSLAEQFGVSSIPTLILFHNGKEQDRFVGVKDAEFIKNFVTR